MTIDLKILGYDYTVGSFSAKESNATNCGFCVFSEQHIGIDQDLSPDMKNSTLLHEIIEALNFHLELKLEHSAITALEGGLYQVLKDNKLGNFSQFFERSGTSSAICSGCGAFGETEHIDGCTKASCSKEW